MCMIYTHILLMLASFYKGFEDLIKITKPKMQQTEITSRKSRKRIVTKKIIRLKTDLQKLNSIS